MTIDEALNVFDETRPNQHARALKVRWLGQLDWIIWRDCFATHEMPEDAPREYAGYAHAAGETVLLAPAPYDDMYLHYLAAESDLVNGENAKYENDRLLFQNVAEEYEKWFNRTYPPKYLRHTFTF